MQTKTVKDPVPTGANRNIASQKPSSEHLEAMAKIVFGPALHSEDHPRCREQVGEQDEAQRKIIQ